jgi:tetratricopeptide (TPR) repeat protein
LITIGLTCKTLLRARYIRQIIWGAIVFRVKEKIGLALFALIPTVQFAVIAPVYANSNGARYTAHDLYLIASFAEKNAATATALSRQYNRTITVQSLQIAADQAALTRANKAKAAADAAAERARAAGNADKAKAERAQRVADAANARAEAAEAKLAESLRQRQDELAVLDPNYAIERGVLNSVGQLFLQSSDGRLAFEDYVSGKPNAYRIAAPILEKISEERAKTYDALAQKKKAADLQLRAYFAYDAWNKGQETAANTAELFEQVVVADPTGYNDWQVLANLRQNMGQLDRALAAAKSSIEAAKLWEYQRADSLRFLGDVLTARSEFTEAGKAYEQALAINRELILPLPVLSIPIVPTKEKDIVLIGGKQYRKMPDEFENSRKMAAEADLSSTLSSYSQALSKQGNSVEAIKLAREATDLSERLLKLDPNSEGARFRLAFRLMDLGDALFSSYNVAGAAPHFERALEIFSLHAKAHSDTLFYQSYVAAALERNCNVHLNIGTIEQARNDADQALLISQRLADADGSSWEAKRNLEKSWTKVGEVALKAGDPKGALTSFEKALAIQRMTLTVDPNSIQAKSDRRSLIWHMANAEEALKHYDSAMALREERLKLQRELTLDSQRPKHDSRSVASDLSDIANLLSKQENRLRSMSYRREGVQILRKLLLDDTAPPRDKSHIADDVIVEMHVLGMDMYATGDKSGATSQFEEALKIARDYQLFASSESEFEHYKMASIGMLVILDAPGHPPEELADQMERMRSQGQLTQTELTALNQLKAQIKAMVPTSRPSSPNTGKQP